MHRYIYGRYIKNKPVIFKNSDVFGKGEKEERGRESFLCTYSIWGNFNICAVSMVNL